jgi:RsiW-degrading membrane proteinase PrsW (M82 family)
MYRLYVVLALGPALALLFLFRWFDKKRPEPIGAVWKVVVLGVAACFPAYYAERWAQEEAPAFVAARGHLLHAFGVAASTEEILKLGVVLLFVWRKDYFNEVMDGVLYLAAASMGFAGLENVFYVMSSNEDALVTGIVRALTAVPQHAIASGVMGYFVGRGKMAKSGRGLWVLGGLAFGVGIHGMYDWCLMSGGTLGLTEPIPFLGLVEAFGIVVGCGVLLVYLVRHALLLDDQLLGPYSRPLGRFAPLVAKPD